MEINNFYSVSDNPTYDLEIRKLQNNDPANAETIFNPLLSKIINNVHAVKLQSEKLLKSHNESANAHKGIFAVSGSNLYDCDWNEMAENGMYLMSNSDNSPLEFNGTDYNIGILIVGGDNSAIITQMCVLTHRDKTNNKLLVRTKENNKWSDWLPLTDVSNADTVDGKHADEFYPINGGKLNGLIEINQYNEEDDNEEYNGISISDSGISIDYNDQYGTEGYSNSLIMSSASIKISESYSGSLNNSLILTSSGIQMNSGSITEASSVTANEFIGDGSGLANVNADTVDGKHASDLQNYNNLTNKPASLPANGGNADTVDGKHASDLQNYNNLTNKPTSLPADGGIAEGIKIPNDGGYTTDQYGNFKHNSDNTQNTWNIVSGEGANKFSVNFENGNVSTSGTIKAENFSGDGSGLTNVNAKTVMNRNIEEIQTRDRGYAFYTSDESYDWNDITNSGYYGLMKTTSAAKHNPVGGSFFYPFVFKAIPHNYDFIDFDDIFHCCVKVSYHRLRL